MNNYFKDELREKFIELLSSERGVQAKLSKSIDKKPSYFSEIKRGSPVNAMHLKAVGIVFGAEKVADMLGIYNKEPQAVSKDDVISYEHPVDAKHMELVKEFKYKELAFAVSEKLLRLESISRGLFLKAESDIERLIDTAEIIVGEQTTNQKGRMVGKEEKKKA